MCALSRLARTVSIAIVTSASAPSQSRNDATLNRRSSSCASNALGGVGGLTIYRPSSSR
jgi:hypothetical protein